MKTNSPTIFFPDEQLKQARQHTDPTADAAVAGLFAEHNFAQLNGWISTLIRNDQPVPVEFPLALSQYFARTALLPEWANRRQMQQGAAFFARHSRPILSILGCYSLPYCYAAADGAQVLWLSQRIRNDARRRLVAFCVAIAVSGRSGRGQMSRRHQAHGQLGGRPS